MVVIGEFNSKGADNANADGDRIHAQEKMVAYVLLASC